MKLKTLKELKEKRKELKEKNKDNFLKWASIISLLLGLIFLISPSFFPDSLGTLLLVEFPIWVLVVYFAARWEDKVKQEKKK